MPGGTSAGEACQMTLRSAISTTRPSGPTRLRVSRAGTASRPPTGSSANSASNLSDPHAPDWDGPSCTAQSCSFAPSSSGAAATSTESQRSTARRKLHEYPARTAPASRDRRAMQTQTSKCRVVQKTIGVFDNAALTATDTAGRSARIHTDTGSRDDDRRQADRAGSFDS